MVKKNRKRLVKSFGVNEYGLVDLPIKISGTTISRLLIGEWMGCEYCFPHGIEVINSRWNKQQRNWKGYRKTQWKPLSIE